MAARRDGGGGGRCGSGAGAEGARTTTVERVGVRVRSAMKPMPHASFSLAGSYSPTFFGAVVTPAVRCASADMAPTRGAKSPESARIEAARIFSSRWPASQNAMRFDVNSATVMATVVQGQENEIAAGVQNGPWFRPLPLPRVPPRAGAPCSAAKTPRVSATGHTTFYLLYLFLVLPMPKHGPKRAAKIHLEKQSLHFHTFAAKSSDRRCKSLDSDPERRSALPAT
eukprot:COSAG04_NODE_1997_length_5039_cov_2.659514_5_plen_226_part_00